jgi:hypothetical protein
MTYLAVGTHVWGRGETIREAIKVARSQGGRSPKFLVWSTEDPNVAVDQMGYILSGVEFAEPVKVGTFNSRGREVK